MTKLEIEAESTLREGSSVCLKCLYDLERGEEFEAIEWYKDNHLFFIYTYDTSRNNNFNQTDIEIDVS